MPKLFYPGQLTCGTKTFTQGGKHYRVISLEMLYDFHKKTPLVFDKHSTVLGQVSQQLLTPYESFQTHYDEGNPKTASEWRLYGHAYSQGLKEKGEGAVSVSLGDMRKTLAVFGPRVWKRDPIGGFVASEPEPVDSVPLVHEFAFGGKEFKLNPKGRGIDGEGLPMVEHPNGLVLSKNDTPKEVGAFVAIPEFFYGRQKLAGTRDEKWVKTMAPAFPDDFSWDYYFTAPKDQRKSGFFIGDETFELVGLNSNEPSMKGKLPGYRARLFYTLEDSMTLRDISPKLDTVTFFPDEKVVSMVWRGLIEVSNPTGSNISHVVAAYEAPKDFSRTLDYYQRDFNWRVIESDYEPLYEMLVTGPLVPSDEISAQRIIHARAKSLEADNVATLAKVKNSMNQMVDAMTNNGMAESTGQMTAKMDAKAAEGFLKSGQLGGKDAAADQIKAKSQEVLKEMNKVMMPLAIASANRDLEEEEEAASLSVPMPNTPETKRLIERVERIIPFYISDPLNVNADDLVQRKLDAVGAIMHDFQKTKQIQALNEAQNSLEMQVGALKGSGEGGEQLEMLESSQKKIASEINALLYNHPKPKDKLPRMIAFPSDPESPERKRMQKALEETEKMISTMPKGMFESLPQEKKMGLDMGLSLMGGEGFEGKIKEDAQVLNDTFFNGYLLSSGFMDEGLSPHEDDKKVQEAVLNAYHSGQRDFSFGDYACIDLVAQKMPGSDFSHCYLEQVDFSNADLSGCDFKKAVLVRCNFSGSNLKGVDLRGANYSGSDFSDADLRDCRMNGDIPLSKVKFNRTNLQSCIFRDMNFDECLFTEANFRQTEWHDMTVNNSVLAESDFTEAKFNSASFSAVQAHGARFDKATFDRANVSLFFIDYTTFKDAKFSYTSLSQMETSFGKAPIFDGAKFYCCGLGHSDFTGTSFKNVELKECNTMGSTFEHCDFEGAQLQGIALEGASLKNSNFSNANMLQTRLQDANLKNSTFKDANLYGAEFARSTLGGTDFSGANLEGTIIENWRPAK